MSGNPKDPMPADLPDAGGSDDLVCPKCGGAIGDPIGGVCRSCAAAAMLGEDFEETAGLETDGPSLRSIGSYEILDEIGRGGMGVIYRARRPDLDRRVALKALDARMGDNPGAWARFRMEIEAVAALDHPNIVPIYDIGEDEGAPFYTMKLLDGGTLADWLHELPGDGRLKDTSAFRDAAELSAYRRGIEKSGGRAAWLMAKVARAVQHAHERGILHRDLKPSNILLNPDGEPFVADFGLARKLDGESDLTISGAIVGTPHYMSPEQARGRNRDLTLASDIFSLGAILFHVLTGRRPYEGETALDVIRNVSESEERDPRSVSMNVDRGLATICRKAMAPEPNRRYPTAESLADDLERWLRGEPISARPPSTIESFILWTRRRPAWAALLAVSIVASVAIMVLTESSRRRIRTERDSNAKLAEENGLLADERAREAERALKAMRERTEQLDRIEFNRASELLIQGERQHGVALLAGILRRSPGFHPARDRALMEARRFERARLACPPMNAGGGISALKISPDGSRAYAVTGKKAQVWDLRKGVRTLEGFGSETGIVDVDLSGDGRTLATVSDGGVAKFWNAATGEQLGPDRKVPGKGRQVRLNRDGTRLVVASWPETCTAFDRKGGPGRRLSVRESKHGLELSPTGDFWVGAPESDSYEVYRSADSKVVCSFESRGSVRRAVFSEDERHLAVSGMQPRAIRIYALEDGSLKHRIECDETVSNLSWSVDGRRVCAAMEDGSVMVIDAETGALIPNRIRHSLSVHLGLFNRDASLIATVAKGDTVRVWPAGMEGKVWLGLRHEAPIARFQFTPQGDGLVTAAGNGEIRSWSVRPLAEKGLQVIQRKEAVRRLEFDAKSRWLATSTQDPPVWITDVTDGSTVATSSASGRWPLDIEFSPAADLLAVGGKGKALALLAAPSFTPSPEVLTGGGWIATLRFSPDGRLIADYNHSHTVRVCDARTGRPLWISQRTKAYPGLLAFSPDGGILAASDSERRIRFFHAETGEQAFEPVQMEGGVSDLEFSPKGGSLAVGQGTGVVILDPATGAELLSLRHGGSILDLEFSHDGARIATASRDTTARIWDVRKGLPLTQPLEHGASVRSVAFDSEANRLLTSSYLGHIRIWDVDRGLPIHFDDAHALSVDGVRISPDRRWAATGSRDRTARIWRMPERLKGDVPEWFPGFLEGLAGARLNSVGLLTGLAESEVEERFAAIPEDASDSYAKAAGAFLQPGNGG